MHITYTPHVQPGKYLETGSPKQTHASEVTYLVIPMDLVNLHEVADLHKYLFWYSLIPLMVSVLAQKRVAPIRLHAPSAALAWHLGVVFDLRISWLAAWLHRVVGLALLVTPLL